MSSAAGGSNTGTGGGPRGPKSAAYRSAIAVQTNASKYRNKYKELKKKVREIENENERVYLKTLRIKRNLQRMRLERALLYEYLDAELGAAAPATTEQEYAASRTALPPKPGSNLQSADRPSDPSLMLDAKGGRSISQSREAVDAYVIGEKEKRKAAEIAAQQQQQTSADQNGGEATREGEEDAHAMEVDAAANASSSTPGPAAANRVKITIKRSAGPNTAT
ncbi:hypothetical protein IE81DRAFT_339283 [Ceraceosorus guamensis]|uniref:INO80 complex subunit F domain-containing protein n=1 Tax=Ceraceosorus guamensis TaxID=1522189 RepID=A0A316W7D7_9BASI|nr:hypothetical protein IE81DRAFT_339283 [Ceraceosorus guamensis]PWN45732.1 hypothetical protein IE81DRAFT_339283 [Ceraceosorus guamensis]